MCAIPRILVVDDEPLICRVMTRLFASSCSVTCSASLDETLAMLGEGKRFDVILLDLSLGAAAEVAARIAAVDADQERRIVLHTGYAAEQLASSDAVGTGLVLTKPASKGEIAALVKCVIGDRGLAAPNAA